MEPNTNSCNLDLLTKLTLTQDRFVENSTYVSPALEQQQQLCQSVPLFGPMDPRITYEQRNCVGKWEHVGNLELQNADEVRATFNTNIIPLWDTLIHIEFRSSSCTQNKYDYRIALGNGAFNIIMESVAQIEDKDLVQIPGRQEWVYKMKLLKKYL